MSKVSKAFTDQKKHAKDRGIEFHFSFKEWCAWWEAALGPDWFKKRGRKKGQYCMARKGDKGNYEAGNVECITAGKNIRDSFLNGRQVQNAVLTEELIVEIYQTKGRLEDVAKKFGIGKRRASHIQNRHHWEELTKHLLPNPKRKGGAPKIHPGRRKHKDEVRGRFSKPDANGVCRMVVTFIPED